MLKYLAMACFTASLVFAADAFAAEPVNHAAILAPFVNQDSFAVAYADIAALDLPKNHETALGPQMWMVMQSLPSEVVAQILIADMAQTLAVRFREAGGQGIYILAGLGDVHIDGGPILIATAQPGRGLEGIHQFFGVTIQEMTENPSYRTLHPYIKQLDVQQKSGVVLVGVKETVARYASMKSAPRNELTSPLARMAGEGAIASVVFCPGADFRRVVRELWPELPGALAPLNGELADRWLHLEAAINGSPKMNPRLALYTSDPESASTFVKLWNDLPTAVTQFGGNKKSLEQARGYAQLLVSTLQAKADGTRVAINVATEPDNLTRLGTMFSQALDVANEASNHRERVQRFKQIAIAMHNYYDTYKCLPPAAIRDKDGKPLLSWRVAILPYIDQSDLYKQFHLDEPWDSSHNRSLIDKLPGTYMDLGPKADQLNREGKTTCQVPVGPQTVFYKNEGTKFAEITDGTSNTILVIEVDPKRAVEWTKPEDWDVDMKQIRKGLERPDRSAFTAAFGDGHVELIDLSKIDDAKLRALLTRAGRETIEQP